VAAGPLELVTKEARPLTFPHDEQDSLRVCLGGDLPFDVGVVLVDHDVVDPESFHISLSLSLKNVKEEEVGTRCFTVRHTTC